MNMITRESTPANPNSMSQMNIGRVNKNALERKVKDMYREVALHPDVTYHFEMGRPLAERLGYPGNVRQNPRCGD